MRRGQQLLNRKLKNMKYKLFLTFGALAAVCLSGCAGRAKYVDSDGSQTVVTAGDINIQDFASAADAFLTSIKERMDQGMIKPAVEGEQIILAISKIVNSTSLQIDTDQLVKKIRVELNKTGKVMTTTILAYGEVEDPLAKETQNFRELSGEGGQPLPDYTLSGKIIDDYARAGRRRQASYIFQMSLTSQKGLAVWEDEKIITKQTKSSLVGW